MEEIIIQKKEDYVLVCVLENGQIVEKYEFKRECSSTIGNIYVGTVKDIIDGMQAAFVDIGLDKNAFLPFKDALPKVDIVKENDTHNDIAIKHALKKGQNLLLQVRKEAFEDKGARVSTHVTLAGNYVVLMPDTDIITISQKIADTDEKERLLDIIRRGVPNNFGCIVRTEAEGISASELAEDFKKILEKWENIKQTFNAINSSHKNLDIEDRLIYDDNNIAMKIARDMVKKTTKKIYVNDNEIYNLLKSVVNYEILEFKENDDFIAEFGLISDFEKIDNRKIWLKCGAQIVIDKTEALTAIDVNSSRCVQGKDLEDTIFKINQEAAIEIMKQLRLKDIGGIIIIDFIDMHKQELKEEILKIMREEQKKDRSKIEVKDFTQLNLVEMTRKKMYV